MINLLSQIPAPAAVPALSANSSVQIEQDFSALLTEMIGAVLVPPAQLDLAVPGAGIVPAQTEPNVQPDQSAAPAPDLSPDGALALQPTPPATDVPATPDPAGKAPATPCPVLKKPEVEPDLHALQAAAVAAVSEAAIEPATPPENSRPAPPVQNADNSRPDLDALLEDVKKLEIIVEREIVKPALIQAKLEDAEQGIISTDPIASTQQSQLPLRMIAIQKVLSDAKTSERKTQPGPLESKEATGQGSAVNFEAPARMPDRFEQVLPAHLVETPNMPKLQVVRTVSMEVGDDQSQVMVRIEDRGNGMNLHFGIGNELLHRSMESSIESLVHALKQEKIEVTNVEISRKSPIEKVRRMKEAH